MARSAESSAFVYLSEALSGGLPGGTSRKHPHQFDEAVPFGPSA